MAHTLNQEIVISPGKVGTGFDKHTVCYALMAVIPLFWYQHFPNICINIVHAHEHPEIKKNIMYDL